MFEIKGKAATAICYAKVVEDEAIQQIRRMCDYDLTRGSKVRIMPDVNAGKGCTIGTTMTINVDEMILRKGAIAAHAGEKVLIPINMRDGSVLAVGKGNPEWNNSAPHGAGRIMSRTKAKQSIDEEMWKTYGRKGIDYPNEQYEKLSEIVEMALQKELLSLIQQGKHVVLDFSFCNKANRAYYKRLIEKAGGTPELVYMKASKGTLQKRLYKRNQSLNANSPFIITNEILEHHYNDFQEPCGEGEKVILQE